MFCVKFATIPSVKISACVITFNEEKNIRRCLESLSAVADEIVVVDSESTDGTRQIAKSLGAQVIVQKWLGFGAQKQFAVERCAHDWILSLDADEELSPELREKLLHLKNAPEESLARGYKIPRLTFYLNRPVRHGGWYPDWQLRFFDRRVGRWKQMLVHESVELKAGAAVEKLKQNIMHRSIETPAEHHRLISERYAPLAAEQMLARGRRTNRLRIYSAGLLAFTQTYLLKLGFLDGFVGFCIARFAAHHAFLKHLLLWELQNKPAPVSDRPATNGEN